MGDDPTDELREARDLLRQLQQAEDRGRELLSALRTVSKDVQYTIRDAESKRVELNDAVSAMIATDINAALTAEMERLTKDVDKMIKTGLQRINELFQRTENILMTGNKRGRPQHGRDLRNLLNFADEEIDG